MDDILTIFSTPRPFKGPFDLIQRNAIESWIKTCPGCKIILFEDEEKTTCKVAEELGVRCITSVERDEFGTPLLNDVYKKAREAAGSKLIVHINTDIILTDSFLKAVIQVLDIMNGKPFFMSGRRWDLDVNSQIDFSKTDWQKEIIELAGNNGDLHSLSGMDYWILPADPPFEILPFIIGRPGMDSWLVYKSREIRIPFIDSTAAVNVIHQNHNYPQKKNHFFKIEKERNLKLSGGLINVMTLREADFILTKTGLEEPEFPRIIFAKLALFYPWRLLLFIKRAVSYSSAYK